MHCKNKNCVPFECRVCTEEATSLFVKTVEASVRITHDTAMDVVKRSGTCQTLFQQEKMLEAASRSPRIRKIDTGYESAIYYATSEVEKQADYLPVTDIVKSLGLSSSLLPYISKHLSKSKTTSVFKRGRELLARKRTELNAHDLDSLASAVKHNRLRGISVSAAAAEYESAYKDIFNENVFYVSKSGYVWHRDFAPPQTEAVANLFFL